MKSLHLQGAKENPHDLIGCNHILAKKSFKKCYGIFKFKNSVLRKFWKLTFLYLCPVLIAIIIKKLSDHNKCNTKSFTLVR